MSERTLRGKVAVVGVAETEYYKWGRSPDPEFKLAIEAVLKACADAGIDPQRRRRVLVLQQRPQRGVAPVRRARLHAAQLRHHAVGRRRRRRLRRGGQRAPRRSPPARPSASSCSGRSPRASSAASGRGRAAASSSGAAAHTLPYGLMSPAQMFAMKVQPLHARPRRPPGRAAGHLAGVATPTPSTTRGR